MPPSVSTLSPASAFFEASSSSEGNLERKPSSHSSTAARSASLWRGAGKRRLCSSAISLTTRAAAARASASSCVGSWSQWLSRRPPCPAGPSRCPSPRTSRGPPPRLAIRGGHGHGELAGRRDGGSSSPGVFGPACGSVPWYQPPGEYSRSPAAQTTHAIGRADAGVFRQFGSSTAPRWRTLRSAAAASRRWGGANHVRRLRAPIGEEPALAAALFAPAAPAESHGNATRCLPWATPSHWWRRSDERPRRGQHHHPRLRLRSGAHRGQGHGGQPRAQRRAALDLDHGRFCAAHAPEPLAKLVLPVGSPPRIRSTAAAVSPPPRPTRGPRVQRADAHARRRVDVQLHGVDACRGGPAAQDENRRRSSYLDANAESSESSASMINLAA